MNDMIEGNTNENANVIGRLHGIIRPFLLRRLKKDVEKQMPGKYEHIVKCQLSRRQMLMYEEFLARSSTRKALNKAGNFMGMMNVLMQLRKVCNHPDLFEPRSVITPFVLDPAELSVPSCVFDLMEPPSFFDATSIFLRVPLWCGSRGDPSLMNACRHDDVESEELKCLERPIQVPEFQSMATLSAEDGNDELVKLEADRHKASHEALIDKATFLNSVNSWRCRAPSFPFSSRLLEQTGFLRQSAETVEFNALTTTTQFFELRKSQQTRAEECDEMIKKVCLLRSKGRAQANSSTQRRIKNQIG
jgi:hypothetical protein